MVEQQFQKSHSTNAHPYQTKYATDKGKTTKTNVSNPMSKQILKNTPSQSRERPLSLQLPPAAIGYHVAKRNPAATITLRHTTKCSTSDYTSCRRIIGKTTHHNLPHYNIVGRGHAHSLPPYNIGRKDTHGCSPSYNIVGRGINCNPSPYNIVDRGQAHSLPSCEIVRKDTHGNSPHYNIAGRGINCNPSPYNIVDRGQAHSLPPCDIAGKSCNGDSRPYNFVGRGHATILLLNIIGGEPPFRDNERWLS